MKKHEEILTRLPIVSLLACICCFLWGSASPSIKTGYAMLNIVSSDTASILLFAGLRFTLAGVMTIIACSFIRGHVLIPKRSSIADVIKLSMVQTVLQYIFFYIGLAHATGVKGAVMVSTNVFLSIVVSAYIFRTEHMTLQNLLGSLVGFAGIIIINLGGGEGLDFNMSFLGEGFVVLASLSYAFSSNMIKGYSKNEDTFTLSGWQFFIGGIVLSLLGYTFGGRISGWSIESCLLLTYLAFISAMAYTLWSMLLKYNPISRVSVFGFLNPLSGALLSAVILHEGDQLFNIRGLAAVILVCTGIFIVNVKLKRPD